MARRRAKAFFDAVRRKRGDNWVKLRENLEEKNEQNNVEIAESAICLVQDCSELAGGIYTPAPAMGEKLITRLVDKAGLTFDIL